MEMNTKNANTFVSRMMTVYFKCMVLVYFILICNGNINKTSNEYPVLSRPKRYLPFLGNSIEVVVGIGVPIEIHSHHILLGWAIRATYNLPTNISQLAVPNYRRRRSLSRWDIYKLLEKDSEIRGHGGRHCILRLICEESDTPLDKYDGLFEELFHVIFTPTTTNERITAYEDQEYYKAQMLGQQYKGRCKQIFPSCKLTMWDMFTR